MSASDWSMLESAVVTCRKCPRLVEWRERVACEKKRAFAGEVYWGKPVPGFGDQCAAVLAVGLAPGAHGSNRTGRMFTGDASGGFLYPALHRARFASQAEALSRGDGLALQGLFISAVCRCAPPGNKPLPGEMAACLPYLREEIRLLGRVRVIVALGGIAYREVIRLLNDEEVFAAVKPALRPPPFGHGSVYQPGSGYPAILASYHPSRQNTNTGRLTRAMFDRIWREARILAEGEKRTTDFTEQKRF